MEINVEVFDKKALETIDEIAEKSPTIAITAAVIFPMLKAKLFREKAENKQANGSKSPELHTHGFPFAINELLYSGKKAKRAGWNGKDQYIELGYSRYSTNDKSIYEPGGKVIVFHGTSGVQVGWLASQGDMLAKDWIVFD